MVNFPWWAHCIVLSAVLLVAIVLLATRTRDPGAVHSTSLASTNIPSLEKVLQTGNDAGGNAIQVNSVYSSPFSGNKNQLQSGQSALLANGLSVAFTDDVQQPTYGLGDVLSRGNSTGTQTGITAINALNAKNIVMGGSGTINFTLGDKPVLALVEGSIGSATALGINTPTSNMQLFNGPRLSRNSGVGCCVGNCIRDI